MHSNYASGKAQHWQPLDLATWAFVAAVTVLGGALRLYGLDAQSLWMDEIASLGNAHAFSTGGLSGLARADHIAPLHSVILWIATTIGGENAVAMRLPSVLSSTLTIPVFYVLGLRLFASRLVGAISAVLACISPLMLWYAQEARMYAMLALFACSYVALVWPLVERPLRAWEYIAIAVLTTFGMYTHHYMVLLCTAFGVFLVLSVGIRERRFWVWALTQAISFFIFCYWLMLTADKLDANAGMSKPAILLWTPYTFFNFLVGFSLGPSVREIRVDGPISALVNHTFSVAIVFAAAVTLGLSGIRRAARADFRIAGLWLLAWLVIPIVLAIVATFVTNITYHPRYVVVSYPPLVLIYALAISDLLWSAKTGQLRGDPKSIVSFTPAPQNGRWYRPVRILAAGALLASMVLSMRNYYTSEAYSKEDVRSIAQLLRLKDSDILLISENSRILPILNYYGAHTPSQSIAIDDAIRGQTPEKVIQALNLIVAEAPREVWLLEYRSWETDPTGKVRSRLSSLGDQVEERHWPGVTLRRYAMRSSLHAD
jgi:uncharacterized membrane protein